MRSSISFQKVAIAGATGAVGQQLILSLLKECPDVELHLAASARAGVMSYEKAISHWMGDEDLPERIAHMKVHSVDTPFEAKWVFSALPSELAAIHEPRWVSEGKWVISMASTHRMNIEVPMVVKDVNQSHLKRALAQMQKNQGVLICKPNCAAAILATFVKPLMNFGLKRVNAVSLQSLSGAGFPGPSAWQMSSDFVGHIEDEAQKIESEMPKLLGEWDTELNRSLPTNQVEWTVTSMRVPVIRGHSLQLSLEFDQEIKGDAFEQALKVQYLTKLCDYRQLTPRKVVSRSKPMQVYWGNHRMKTARHHQVFVIGDNLGRGAATGAVALWFYCLDQLARLT